MGVDVNSVIFVGKHTKDPREYFTEEQLEGLMVIGKIMEWIVCLKYIL
jgi:hypothetical protein